MATQNNYKSQQIIILAAKNMVNELSKTNCTSCYSIMSKFQVRRYLMGFLMKHTLVMNETNTSAQKKANCSALSFFITLFLIPYSYYIFIFVCYVDEYNLHFAVRGC